MKVYITGSSYRQLTKNSITTISIDKIENFLKNKLNYPRLFFLFTKKNLEFLFKNYLFLSGAEESKEFIKYNYVKEREDDYKYVIELEGKLKYHINKNCKFLVSGFNNFFIPKPIADFEKIDKDIHSILVEKIREWFKENDFTIEKYKAGKLTDRYLTNKFNSEFVTSINEEILKDKNNKLNKIFISDNLYRWYVHKNSGVYEVNQSFEINDFNRNVSELLEERKLLCKNQDEYYILGNFDYLFDKSDSEFSSILSDLIMYGHLPLIDSQFINEHGNWNNFEKIKMFLKKHREIKLKIIEMIIEMIKFKYNNHDFQMEHETLEDFNFECCSICKREINNLTD
jgi:hypothetical protein